MASVDETKATQPPIGERIALEMFGVDIAKARDEQRCVPPPIGCGQPATTFMDELSKKEYQISGLCQNCQDEIFGGQS